jgi:multisubunit Na+/H+ antiporter MnhB subunit
VSRHTRSLRALAAVASATLGALVLYAVFSLPPPHTELAAAVDDAMGRSGVTHRVTAVLLGFRGWDTCLEVGVLLLAVLGVTRADARFSAARPSVDPFVEPPLAWLVRLVVPALVLGAGHILLVGTSGPGGAFQAGSLLAAAGVLLTLGGHDVLRRLPAAWLRGFWVAGLGVFVLTGALTLLRGRLLLELDTDTAAAWMVAIELGVMGAVATGLAWLFLAARDAGGGP